MFFRIGRAGSPLPAVGAHGMTRPTLSRHRQADHVAPLTDAFVALFVDGFVFPHRALAGSRQRLRIGVIGHGVYGQKAKARSAIHPHFQSVHPLFRPSDDNLPGVHVRRDDGFKAVQIHRLFRTDDLQRLPDGLGIAGRNLDARDQCGDAPKNVRRDERGRRAQHRHGRHGIEHGRITVAGGVFVGRPLLRIGGRSVAGSSGRS